MPSQPDFEKIHSIISRLLGETTKQLALFLEDLLPTVFDDWWSQAVLNALTYQQSRRIEQGNIATLASLDLAALLRVLDQNWYQISTNLDLSSETRHFVKEMQTIRNRWAHMGPKGIVIDDVYRDLDTLQRFLGVIKSDDRLMREVKETKAAILKGETGTESASKPEESTDASSPSMEFSPGQIVTLRSDPSMKGAVVEAVASKPENRFKVFIDGSIQTYYASQLQSEDKPHDEFQFLRCDQFHAYLSALQIRYPGLSTLYSLNAARVDFIPYQFRPVLRFIRSDRPRLLIADSVGVGKTIEAGLILRELQARRDIKSILIICPRPLVTERKWKIEMKRFDERFIQLDGPTLRYCISEMDRDGVWPDQHQRVILPYSLFDEGLLFGSKPGGRANRRKGLLDLDPPPRFDVVIVDEAHHVRNTNTYAHRAVRFFCDHAEAVLFLTATPIQMGDKDLFVLLNLLRPDLILDPESFEHMSEPNPFINQAVDVARSQEMNWTERARELLDQAASTDWGQAILRYNPDFNRIRGEISRSSIPPEERIRLIREIEGLHTLNGVINRTRRRDIGDFTVRKPQTVIVEFTPEQEELHNNILAVQAEIFRRLHGNANVMFMMTTIRRQAASCIHGLAPLLQEILNRHIDELDWDEADDTGSIPEKDAIGSIEAQIESILSKAMALDPNDPKLEALRKILGDKRNLPNNKIMVFSSFRHTLNYLYENLKTDGFRVGLIHGGTPDEDRRALRNRFEKAKEDIDRLDVLLFSEVGCEGLDYQFCDCIVNYDLPWNPMRVEQRIGRIDRNGQQSESVVIYNLITPGTVDADIYTRCMLRIGVFNRALGGSEEIMGEITREIKDIAMDFELTEEERQEKLQQLADNKIRLVQEQEELEKRQVELFGIRLPEDQMRQEIEEASSFWLTPGSMQRLVSIYLQQTCGRDQDFILGEKALKALRLSQDARGILLHDFRKLPRQNTTAYRDWENWLKGPKPHLPITFESDCAQRHPEAVFIMPVHPLARQAAMSLDTEKRVITTLKVESNDVPEGRYEFAIYQWRFEGIKEDMVLKSVALTDTLAPHLDSLLEQAVDTIPAETVDRAAPVWKKLDESQYDLWSQARATHQQRNRELAEYRRESLTTSHRARISLLDEQLSQATDEKIRRMRQSQIDAAEADYARRIQELDIAMERAEVISEPVAYGVINIVGDGPDAK